VKPKAPTIVPVVADTIEETVPAVEDVAIEDDVPVEDMVSEAPIEEAASEAPVFSEAPEEEMTGIEEEPFEVNEVEDAFASVASVVDEVEPLDAELELELGETLGDQLVEDVPDPLFDDVTAIEEEAPAPEQREIPDTLVDDYKDLQEEEEPAAFTLDDEVMEVDETAPREEEVAVSEMAQEVEEHEPAAFAAF